MIGVTGASGFLGERVVRELRERGEDVRSFGGPRSPVPNRLDVTDAASLRSAFGGVRTVIHCAGLAHQFGATASEQFFAINERGTQNVLRAATGAGATRFVLVSSVAVYGHGDGPDEQSECVPVTPYGRSKLAAETAASRLALESGIELVILRLATLYGPGDPGNIGRLIHAVESRRFLWLGGGRNRKSILFVDDAARACAAAAARGAPTGVFNVVAETIVMSRIVEEIERATGCPILPLRVPEFLVRVAAGAALRIPAGRVQRAGATLAKWLSDDVYDGSRFRTAYAFVPSVSLPEGIAAEVAARRS